MDFPLNIFHSGGKKGSSNGAYLYGMVKHALGHTVWSSMLAK